MNRKLIVCAFTDKGGTMGMTQAQEYEQILRGLQELVFPEIDLTFEKDITPDDLIHKEYDIYVFDYGGAMNKYGGDKNEIENYYMPLIRRIKGHPEKLFVIWSSYTAIWYRQLIEDESPEFIAPNVITMEWRENEISRARTFFDLSPEIKTDDYFKRIETKTILKTPKKMRFN
jgi:hypothetical protein